jgi:hypothetical protein
MVQSTMHLLLAASLLFAAAAQATQPAPRTPAPEGAKVYFIEPADGATVPQTFLVKFGLAGMGVAPAGVDRPATGHHHLLVNMDEMPPMDQPMVGDIRHFGGGQTEAEITLPPGTHTLQLLLGDMNHVPHDPPVLSEKITVIVE